MTIGCNGAIMLPILTSKCKQHECCLKYLKLDLEVTKNKQNGSEWQWPFTSNPNFVCIIYKAVVVTRRI